MSDHGQVAAPNAIHPPVVAEPPPPSSRVSADRVAEIVLKLVAAEHDRDRALRDIERLQQERDHARSVAERLERSLTQASTVLTIQEQATSATGDRAARALVEIERLRGVIREIVGHFEDPTSMSASETGGSAGYATVEELYRWCGEAERVGPVTACAVVDVDGEPVRIQGQHPMSPTAADAVAALVRAARARVEATQMVQTSAGIAFTGDDEQSDAEGGAR